MRYIRRPNREKIAKLNAAASALALAPKNSINAALNSLKNQEISSFPSDVGTSKRSKTMSVTQVPGRSDENRGIMYANRQELKRRISNEEPASSGELTLAEEDAIFRGLAVKIYVTATLLASIICSLVIYTYYVHVH